MPVLPPIGQLSDAAFAAVPRWTTPRSRFVITKAVSARMASFGSGRFSSSTFPSRSETLRIGYGRIRTPWFGNTEYALVISVSVASAALCANRQYGGIGDSEAESGAPTR